MCARVGALELGDEVGPKSLAQTSWQISAAAIMMDKCADAAEHWGTVLPPDGDAQLVCDHFKDEVVGITADGCEALSHQLGVGRKKCSKVLMRHAAISLLLWIANPPQEHRGGVSGGDRAWGQVHNVL